MTSWLSFRPDGLTGLEWLQVLSSAVMELSFLILAAALIYIYRRRGEHSPVIAAMVAVLTLFIVAIGLAQLASLLAVWSPGALGAEPELLLKAVGAALALVAAIALWTLAPRLLQIPSRDRLQAEVAAHLQTVDELKGARHQLEERVEARTKELADATQRIEIALRGSPISVFSQDRDMRVTWVHNPPAGLPPDSLIGKTDAEILPDAAAAASIMAAKRQTMETGKPQELETNFELGGRQRSFYFMIEALRDEHDRVLGTTSVAVDLSERKANEDQLRLLLRELTHRCKNLLAVIHAIARQTAARTRSIDDFLDRFSARLVAIGASHDLLIADDWHGASLRMLVEQQLGKCADRFGDIAIEGEDIMLKPEAVQNLGLALHELAANAQKYGALSAPDGHVSINWNFCDETSKLKLVWQEKGGPVVTPPERSGFGRAMLEKVVGKALEGDVTLAFPPKGVRCEIVISSAHVISRG